MNRDASHGRESESSTYVARHRAIRPGRDGRARVATREARATTREARVATREGRRRRGTAWVASVLAMAGSIVVVTAASTTVAASAATPGPAFTCDAFGYLFQSPNGRQNGPHDVDLIDLATGAQVDTGANQIHIADDVNAVGYNQIDNHFYGYDVTTDDMVSIDADYNLTHYPLPANVDHFVGMSTGNNGPNVGDFDDAGHLWLANANDQHWAEIDFSNPAAGTFDTTLAFGTYTLPAGITAGADWTYINGAFYGVGNDATPQAHLTAFHPDGSFTDQGALSLPGSAGVGATYADSKGFLYASNNSGPIYRIKPNNRNTLNVANGPSSSTNDGARCASAAIPTMTVTKQVNGRAAAGDQFTVGLSDASGSATTSATTAGTDTTVSTTDFPVTQGGTYTITDAMAAGSPNPIGDYNKSIACTNTATGAALATTGTGPTWTVTIPGPDAYGCTVTNAAAVTNLGITKTASATSIGPGGQITWTLAITNAGPDTSPGYRVSDVLPAGLTNAATTTPGCTIAGGTVTCVSTTAFPANGPARNVVITANGPTANGACVTNTATVAAMGIDRTQGNNTSAPVTTCVANPPQLHTTKTVSTANAVPGQQVTYTIVSTNTGTSDWTVANPAVVSDDLTDAMRDASYDGDATVTDDNGTPDPNPIRLTGNNLTWAGPLAAGHHVTITFTVTVNTGDFPLNNTVVSQGNCVANSGDPECSTTTKVAALHVSKSSSNLNAIPGSTVGYTVTVSNPGTGDWTAANPAALTDDLSDVLLDGVYNGDAVLTLPGGGTTTAGLVYDNAGHLTWSGPLAAGGSFTITYSVKLNDPSTGPDHDLVNTVSAPHSNCPGDAACSTTNTVPDLTAVKTSTATSAQPGKTIPYTITLTNNGSGDWTAGTPASFADNLFDVLDDATYDNDALVTMPGGATTTTGIAPPAADQTLRWQGALAHGQSITLTYSVTVNNPDRGNHNLINGVQTPVGDCGPNGTAALCPPTDLGTRDLTTLKVASTQSAAPGQQITYTVTLTSSGTAPWPAGTTLLTDDLSDVLDDATLTAGPTAANPDDAAAPTVGAGNVLTYTAGLGVGHTAIVTYTVTVNQHDTGNHRLANTAVPVVGCAPGDPACTPPPVTVPDLHVVKTADTANASEGSHVTYTITATNDGTGNWTAANPATLDDNLANVLDDASFDGMVVVGGAAEATGTPVDTTTQPGHILWQGALNAGDTVTFTYTVVVNTPDTGDHLMPNTVITPGDCIPGSTDPGCTATVKNADLAVTKVASSANGSEGSVITYTITATNTGQGDWTGANPAVITDDLSGVTDDATPGAPVATGAADATATQPAYLGASTIQWRGALDAGHTVMITYSVTVNTPDTGDHIIANAVTAPGNCRTSSAAGCTAITKVADLDVSKTVDTQNAAPGTVVHYTITAKNTGAGDWTAANPAVVGDDLTNVLDDATYNGDAATAGDSSVQPTYAAPTITWSDALAAGKSVTITYSVTVNTPDRGDHQLLNAVQAPGGDCRPGSVDPACSTVSKVPDLTVTKTASAATAQPGDTITYTLTATDSGQGDWTAGTPATLSDDLSGVLDDAAYNNDATTTGDSNVQPNYSAPTISWSDALAAGQSVTITYSVTIDSPDKGDHELPNTVVGPMGTQCAAGSTDTACSTDTLLADLAVAKLASTQNVGPEQTVDYTITAVSDGKAPWTAADVPITDDLTNVLDDATYNNDAVATASSGAPAQPTYTEPVLSWSGDLAVGATLTITYSVTVNDPDTGDHKLTNAIGSVGNCADQTDPTCSTQTLVADLDVSKTVDTQNAAPGTVVHYTITAKNTGAGDWTAANPAVVGDDLTNVLDDATYNGDAATTGDSTVQPIFATPTLTWSDALAAGKSVTITYSVTVSAPDLGDHQLLNAVQAVGNCRTGSVDPACSTVSNVPDLAVTKTASTATAQPGDTISYTLTATNSGKGDWTAGTPATLSDDLSGVLDDAAYNNDATTTGDSSVQPTYTAPTISWSDALAAGKSVTITYSVTIDSPDKGDHALPNTVVGPMGTQCAAGSTDPACTTNSLIADLAIMKTSSTANIGPGQTVTYTITAISDGEAPWISTYAPISDDLTNVLDDATYNNDAQTVVSSGPATQPTYAQPVLSWSGDLDVGVTMTITYSVTVNDPDTGDHALPNAIGSVGNCADPTDPTCSTQTLVADLTVSKTADNQNAAPGSKVSYTLTAVNSGKGDWTVTDPASLYDDLTNVLDDATYDDDAAAAGSMVAPSYSPPMLSWSGPLAAGDTLTITYSATVNSPDTGDHDLPNTVVSAIGDCEVGTTNPACSADPKVPDLTVVKTAGAKTAEPGKKLEYSIVVTNPGQGDWTDGAPAVVTDDLSKVLDDATYNGDATVSGAVGSVHFAKPDLTWTGPLAAGHSVTITYSVTPNERDTGDHHLDNVVKTSVGSCTDPAMPGCSTTTPEKSYTVTKTSDPASGAKVDAGKVVHYRLQIVNTGQVDLTPTVTDDLTKALDDATWNGDEKAPTGSLSFHAPRLHWRGSLPIGATVVITYSVTVNKSATGDGKLINVVGGSGPLTNCVTDPTTCSTNSSIIDPPAVATPSSVPTASTAAIDTQRTLLIAGLFLLLGLFALLLGRGGAAGGLRRTRGPRGPQGPRGSSGGRRLTRIVPALLALGACAVLVGCSGASSGDKPGGSPSVADTGGGKATVTVAGLHANLQVTSCTKAGSVVQVVAQSGAAWTAQLRRDTATKSTFLVLVHHTNAGVRTYQASADASHPHGIDPTRIDVIHKDASFSARATLSSYTSAKVATKSATTKTGATTHAKAPRPKETTATGGFDATCSHMG